MDASSIFTGPGLTIGVTGEGVSINPSTGELSIATERLSEGITLSLDLRLAPEGAAPQLLTLPSLKGEGRVGAAVTVNPGTWSGTPAPDLAMQWLADGADIAGATEAAFVPAAADEGRTIACRIVARNIAGSVAAETAGLVVIHLAPAVVGVLPDVTATAGEAVTVEAARAFEGEGLSFAASGAGARADAATGIVTVPAEAPLEGEAVTVTARNSGGEAEAGFRVTVVPRIPDFPAVLAAGLWSAAEVRDQAPAGRRRVRIAPEVSVAAGFELRLYSGPVAGGRTDLSNRQIQPGEDFTTISSMGLGASCHNLLFWRRIEDGAWAPASADEIVFAILGLEPAQPALPVAVAPAVLGAPAIVGTGVIGTELRLDPGLWNGEPAPALAFAWLRDGAGIPGATEAAYVPVAADDGSALRARVTASNAAGSRSAETDPVTVRFAPPETVGALADEVFDEGTGPQDVPCAGAFAGESLAFAVTGAGAAVDARTGVVKVPTDKPLSDTVKVSAANSGGAAEASFRVTVEAAEIALPPALPLPPGADVPGIGEVALEGRAADVTVRDTAGLLGAIDARIANPGTGGDYVIELAPAVYAPSNPSGNSEDFGVELRGRHYPGPGRIIIRGSDYPGASTARFRRLSIRDCRNITLAYVHVDRSDRPANSANQPYHALQVHGGCRDVTLYRCRVTGQPDRKPGMFSLNIGIEVSGTRCIARECSISHGFFKAYNLGGGSSHSGLIGCINEDRSDDDYVLGGGLTEDCFIIDCWGGRTSNPTADAHMDFIQGHDWRMNGADNRRLRIRGNVILCGDTGTHTNGIVFFGTKTSDVVVEQNLVGISNHTGVRFTGPDHVNPDHQDNTFFGMPGANANFVHTQVMGPPNGWRAIDTYFNQHTPAPSGRGHLRLALSHGNNLSPYGTVMAEIPHISKDLFALRPLPGMRSHWTHSQKVGCAERWREILEDRAYPRFGPAAESFRRQYDPKGRLP